MLQVLKHLYEREQLNFTVCLLAMEEDYTTKAQQSEEVEK